MSDVSGNHPRRESLLLRERIADGVARGITSIHGLIAHGRGEAFDYLLGERTHPFAEAAITAAAAEILDAARPVISVNGNACALAAEELVELSRLTGAPLEVNIFHTSAERELAIQGTLLEAGADRVLLPTRECSIPGLDHNRRWVHPEGIHRADVIFVPLEDGDRCQALIADGRRVLTVDLNPLSRTAQAATVTIVDNLTRCLPLLIEAVEFLSGRSSGERRTIRESWNNAAALREAEAAIRGAAAPVPAGEKPFAR